ncbi:MAG TPA: GNAT family N-acetyltransferase [Zeimonas sp.]|nr:GNAT family N-acetyltransferase [Zeimonas sp.]
MTTPRCQDPILHERGVDGGTFYIERRGGRVAELQYTRGDRLATIDHTWIDDELRGSGCGRRLVDAIVQWARDERMKLRPLCSFARAVLERTPEYDDVR